MANYTTEEITQALNKVREHFDHGGRYLAAVRTWMQHTFINGDRVTWGSHEFLTGTTLTPHEMERLAIAIMDATVAEMKQHVLGELQDIQMIKDIRARPENPQKESIGLGTEQEMSAPSGRYDVFVTQGQGGSIDASYDTLEEAIDFTDAHKGEASYAIRYPDGEWHEWVLAQPEDLRFLNDK